MTDAGLIPAARSARADERGQVVPFIALFAIGLLIVGFYVFRVGVASDEGASAQAGADAVAVAMVIASGQLEEAGAAANGRVTNADAEARARGERAVQIEKAIDRKTVQIVTAEGDERKELIKQRDELKDELVRVRREIAEARSVDDVRDEEAANLTGLERRLNASIDELARNNSVRCVERCDIGREVSIEVATTTRLSRLPFTDNQTGGRATAHAVRIEVEGRYSGKLLQNLGGGAVATRTPSPGLYVDGCEAAMATLCGEDGSIPVGTPDPGDPSRNADLTPGPLCPSSVKAAAACATPTPIPEVTP